MNTVAGPVGRRQPIIRKSAVLGLLLAVMAPGEGVSAQRLSGRLLDLFSNVPLGSGVLTVRTADQRVVQSALSDEGGHWSFELPGPGVYYVEAARMGYQAWLAGPVEVTAEDDLSFVYHLRPQPIQLDPIEVTVAATRRHLETAGFYDRQRADFGTFLGPEEIEKRRSAPRFTALLLGLPGVRLVTLSTGSVGPRFVQLRGSNLSFGGICRPRVYVDGILYALGDSRPVPLEQNEETEFQEEILQRMDQGLSLDDIGAPGDIAGIEIYRSASQVPAQFGGTSVNTLCGVIVVWTKRGFVRRPG
jgi:hypothetical protein